MGVESFKCVCCGYPIVYYPHGTECVSVYVRKGKREMETLRVGKYTYYNRVEPSEWTKKIYSLEKMEKAVALIKEGDTKYYPFNYLYGIPDDSVNPEEAGMTGFSYWHTHCLLKELDVSRYVERRIQELEREVKRTKKFYEELNITASEPSEEEVELLQLKNGEYNIFENPFLLEKFCYYTLWNQNMISQVTGYTAVQFIELFWERVKEFHEMINLFKMEDTEFLNRYEIRYRIKDYERDHPELQGKKISLADILDEMGIPNEVLQEVIDRRNNFKEER